MTTAAELIKQFHMKPSECSCRKCRSMCEHRACWGTPDQIEKLLAAGLANRLMYDYWVGNFDENPEDEDGYRRDTPIICPAQVGHEGRYAPSWPRGACTFYKAGKCEIHHMKPLEGAVAIHQTDEEIENEPPDAVNPHREIAKTWDTPEGFWVVKEWQRLVNE